MNTRIKNLSKNASKSRKKAKRGWNRNFRHAAKKDLEIGNFKKQISWWD